MTIHVNIGEAKARLSELVAAAVRGEDVVVDRAGEPQVRLVAIATAARTERERIAASRRAALGRWGHLAGDFDLSVEALKADRDADRREAKAIDGAA